MTPNNYASLSQMKPTLEYRINGEVRIIGGGGWKWFDIAIIWGVGIIGGGVLGETENSPFLR